MIRPFHGYTCHRCWLRSYGRDVADRWCGFCRTFADEHDGSSPQLWRIVAEEHPVACTASQIGDWMNSGRESVGFDQVTLRDGSQGFVSTMFMCVDVGGNEAMPMLFETRLARDIGPLFDECTRCYATWAEAKAGHDATIARLKAHGWVR